MKNIKQWTYLMFAVMAICAAFLVWQLVKLDVLPSDIQTPVLVGIGLIVLVIFLALAEFGYKKKVLQSMLVISVILAGGFGTGGYYLFKTNGALDRVTAVRKKNQNKVSVVVLSESSVQNKEDLAGKRVAVLRNIDQAGTEQAVKQLGESGVTFEQVALDSVPQEALQLYEGTVDAIILNDSYRTNVIDLEEFADFNERTRTVFTASYTSDSNNEPLAVSDVTTKPYNILISGNDTYGDVGELSRSDVNMVVTVNPLTSTVLLTSIPRDSYVSVDCGDSYCAAGQMDKITHTGMNGIRSTKQTVEQLLGIEINYTFRVNFSSVTEIVDSLGGIDLEVPEEAATETLYVDSTLEGVPAGWNHLDGARALAFARERYAYVDGDNQRVRNQQMVLKAIFAKATSPDIIMNYPNLLSALQNAFDTTLTSDEITDFIKYQIQARPEWKFESYQLVGDGADLYCPALGQNAYVTVLNSYTLSLAHDKIQAVLDGGNADQVAEPTSVIEYQYTYVPVEVPMDTEVYEEEIPEELPETDEPAAE